MMVPYVLCAATRTLPSTAQRLKEMAVLRGGDATRKNRQRKQKPIAPLLLCANNHQPFSIHGIAQGLIC